MSKPKPQIGRPNERGETKPILVRLTVDSLRWLHREAKRQDTSIARLVEEMIAAERKKAG